LLDQAPDIIGVSSHAMIIILRSIELAARKAAAFVGDHLVAFREQSNQ
jgi:hypothetical protein